jgi:hypothetical protein
MVDVAAFYLKFCVDESCGKCAPCRVGGFQMLQLLEKIMPGRGEPEDLAASAASANAMQHRLPLRPRPDRAQSRALDAPLLRGRVPRLIEGGAPTPANQEATRRGATGP